jgi:hypothetical protein
MRKTEESLRRLKKGKKSTLGIFSGASASKDEDRDEERIRTQMIMDVEAFGLDGKSLGVNITSVESYLQLSQMVQSELVDGECRSSGPLFKTLNDSYNRLMRIVECLHKGVHYTIRYGYQCWQEAWYIAARVTVMLMSG